MTPEQKAAEHLRSLAESLDAGKLELKEGYRVEGVFSEARDRILGYTYIFPTLFVEPKQGAAEAGK